VASKRGAVVVDRRRVSLFLPDSNNHYEQQAAHEARSLCETLRYDLAVTFADGTPQVRQIHAAMTAGKRPDVMLVMPVVESGLKALCESALGAGIGWVFLNRLGWRLEPLQKRYPDVPVGFVCPDQHEVGRIQGRQLQALLPEGGDILYVKGRVTNWSSTEREQGLLEVLARSRVRIVGTLDGAWTTPGGERAIDAWLATEPGRRCDAIACQNDLMAVGAVNALARFHAARSQPPRRVPVLGCDGLAQVGRALVDAGTLAATVVLPTTSPRALGLVSHFFATGAQLPARAALAPEAYPQPRSLGRSAPRAA
jgi:ribose transport system substrate-binding protein